jgi:crotonobetainyl-CoA:carnitine CoA-transferase CaiB-like acyl-CoA transferase
VAAYRPLHGIRVVDMADEKAELCGRLMADLGADVVRVEPPEGGRSRKLPPFHNGESLYFEVRNANKRGTVVDLGTMAGRDALLALLEGADIWVETTRPGQLAAYGLDPAAMAERLSNLVVVSVTDFGRTGPYRDFVASDAVMEAMAWMLFRAGTPELPPVLPPGAIAFDTVGVSAAFAALTGLLDRRTTGIGQHIDMSVMEAVAQTTDWGLTSYSVISKLGLYGEVRDGGGKVYPIIPCRDGFVRPAMVTLAEWRKLSAWIREAGISREILEQDYWDDQRIRLDLFDELLRPIFVEFFKDKDKIALAVEGQDRGIPITPMLSPAEVLESEQFQVLGSFTGDETAAGTRARFASGFLVADGERIGRRHPAPPLGDAGDPIPRWSTRPSAQGAVMAEAGRPYKGLRVMEFGVAGAAPEMGRLLAEYGAEVIRIESPNRVDIFRQLGGPSGMGSVFASSNRSTRSVGVDFTTPAGTEIARELVARADIVLENLPPGTLERFGLGPDELRRNKPSLLIISSQTMGRRGPWSHWRGYGSNTQLPGGMSWLWSFPDVVEPVPQNVAFPDHFVGRLGAFVASADLMGRLNGQDPAGHIEIVQAEMALNLLDDLFAKESLDPGSVQPQGNRSEQGAPWGVYQCSGHERWCVITCRDDQEWAGLVEAMNRPSWALATELSTVEGRRFRQDDIDVRIGEWTAGLTDREVMQRCQAAGVPAGMMMYMSDQPNDPHFRARAYILELDQPALGSILLEGPAFHATGLPTPITFHAPLFGEHTREICRSVLGYSDDKIDRLIAAGLLIEAPDSDLVKHGTHERTRDGGHHEG